MNMRPQRPQETERKTAEILDAVRERADILRQIQTLRARADRIMYQAVHNARSGEHGLTWQAIGDILGVTGQRITQRWGPRSPDYPDDLDNTSTQPATRPVQSPSNRIEGEPTE